MRACAALAALAQALRGRIASLDRQIAQLDKDKAPAAEIKLLKDERTRRIALRDKVLLLDKEIDKAVQSPRRRAWSRPWPPPVMHKKVNWVLEVDIRGFFDAIDHTWMVKFIEHRIADKRIVRLIQKWLTAGVLEEGKWSATEGGTPQGATISPLLANVYLHYVLDLCVQDWRSRHANGEVYIVRYADDFADVLRSFAPRGDLAGPPHGVVTLLALDEHVRPAVGDSGRFVPVPPTVCCASSPGASGPPGDRIRSPAARSRTRDAGRGGPAGPQFRGNPNSYDWGGCSLAGAGDLDADGHDDLVIPSHASGLGGSLSVFYGPIEGPLDPEPEIRFDFVLQPA